MMKKCFVYLSILTVIVLLSACSSTKGISKKVTVGNLSQEEYVVKVIDNGQKLDAISAKSIFTINFDKKDPLSVSGSMKIKRGKAIMLSVAPLLGIEVARMEITPSGVLILDRMKKRYVKASFAELNSYLNNNLDYNSLESLFLNSIFLPGVDGLSGNYSGRFIVSDETDKVVLNVKGVKQLDYSFVTNPTDARLVESDIIVKGTPYRMKWRYNEFKRMPKGEFPSNMNVNIDGAGKKVSLDMELTRLSDEADWQITTEAPKKYQKVGLDDILKMIAK